MPQYTIAKGVFFMAYDLVMHMDACDISLLELTLNNITNYLAGLEGTPCSVSLVANAAAVKLFTKDCPKADRVNELAAKGVAFKLCANSCKRKTGVPPASLSRRVWWNWYVCRMPATPTSNRREKGDLAPRLFIMQYR